MSSDDRILVEGLQEALNNMGMSKRDVRNMSRSGTHAIAAKAVRRAKKYAAKHTGRLRKAIKAKRRRAWPDLYRSDVTVYKGETRKDPKGAYYWHFVEHGTVKQDAQPYIGPAIKETDPEAIKIFKEKVVALAIKRMERRAKK